jgi:YgiT-type zinc finger domain-containing protein
MAQEYLLSSRHDGILLGELNGGRYEEEKRTMICHVCGANYRPIRSHLPFKLHEKAIVVVKDLPVLQCENCPEYLIEDEVMEKVDDLLEHACENAELEVISYPLNQSKLIRDQYVLKRPKGKGWAVRGEGSKKDTSVHPTQKEAIAVARKIAAKQGASVFIISKGAARKGPRSKSKKVKATGE